MSLNKKHINHNLDNSYSLPSNNTTDSSYIIEVIVYYGGFSLAFLSAVFISFYGYFIWWKI